MIYRVITSLELTKELKSQGSQLPWNLSRDRSSPSRDGEWTLSYQAQMLSSTYASKEKLESWNFWQIVKGQAQTPIMLQPLVAADTTAGLPLRPHWVFTWETGAKQETGENLPCGEGLGKGAAVTVRKHKATSRLLFPVSSLEQRP